MATVPAPPVLRSRPDYGDRLGDVSFWTPYVRAVLARHDLPDKDLEVGFVGTYPTFLVGEVVVKLFGCFPSWRPDHDSELAAQHLLAGQPGIPAPRLLAHGRLYDEPHAWPYLVTGRMPGRAWRDVALTRPQRLQVAEELGAAFRRVHDLPPPAGGPLARDWLAAHGDRCADRHRAWGSLPAHLVDQIGSYVSSGLPARQVVHADLTPEHVFVEGGRLAGVIDWGDAMITDPYYELGALHLDTFRADRSVLAAFLTGYGWVVDEHFQHRAMSAALRHQFDLFGSPRLRLDRFGTLTEVAAALWDTRAKQ